MKEKHPLYRIGDKTFEGKYQQVFDRQLVVCCTADQARHDDIVALHEKHRDMSRLAAAPGVALKPGIQAMTLWDGYKWLAGGFVKRIYFVTHAGPFSAEFGGTKGVGPMAFYQRVLGDLVGSGLSPPSVTLINLVACDTAAAKQIQAKNDKTFAKEFAGLVLGTHCRFLHAYIGTAYIGVGGEKYAYDDGTNIGYKVRYWKGADGVIKHEPVAKFSKYWF